MYMIYFTIKTKTRIVSVTHLEDKAICLLVFRTFGEYLKIMFKNRLPNIFPNRFHAVPYDIFHKKKVFISFADKGDKGFALSCITRSYHMMAMVS